MAPLLLIRAIEPQTPTQNHQTNSPDSAFASHQTILHHPHCSQCYLPGPYGTARLSSKDSMAFPAQSSKDLHSSPKITRSSLSQQQHMTQSVVTTTAHGPVCRHSNSTRSSLSSQQQHMVQSVSATAHSPVLLSALVCVLLLR